MSEILKIGIPTLVFQLLTSLSVALINLKARPYGDSVIAGMGAVTRIISMGSLMVFGFLKGFQPIAGYSYGAKKYDRLHEAIKTSILWSTIFCAVFGLGMALCSTAVISQFTKGDVQMIEIGRRSLTANGISFLLFGFYTVYSSLFLSLGKAKEGFILGACRQGICFVPVILLLPSLGNKRHSLRPAGCRCYLCHDHRVYGGAAPQGTERSKVVAFVSLHRTECREATELFDSSAAGILPVQNSLSCMCIRTLFLQISFCQIIKLHPAFYLSALRRHGAEYFQSHFRPLLPCGRIDEIDGPHIVKPVGQRD